MKTTDTMNDEQRKAAWATVAHSEFIGTDPYYRDLNDALWVMAERALAAHSDGHSVPKLGAESPTKRTTKPDNDPNGKPGRAR